MSEGSLLESLSAEQSSARQTAGAGLQHGNWASANVVQTQRLFDKAVALTFNGVWT
jgi:hypothetical protein